MGYNRTVGVFAALTALAFGQAAQANTAIYQGECSRAYQVKENSPISSLMKHSRYKAVSMHRFGEESEKRCDADKIFHWELTLTSSTTSMVTYSVQRKEFYFSKNVPTCERLYSLNNSVIGTVNFSTGVSEANGLCEVYIWSDWKLTDTANATWKGAFANRSIVMNDGSFVQAQPGPTVGLFNTPLAFSGIK